MLTSPLKLVSSGSFLENEVEINIFAGTFMSAMPSLAYRHVF
jgi:hypothetical protein